MKKHLFLSTFLTLVSFQANAQSADLASAIGPEETSSSQAYEEKKSDKQIADDRGAFSFLNFSFIKKPLKLFSNEPEKVEEEIIDDSPDKPKSETPLERATRLAEEGDAEKALTLGYMYLYGQDGVETDYQKAFHFYHLAAQKDNIVALNNLGSLYFNGIGTDVDYEKAAALFAHAAELGSDDAAVNLGFIYLSSDNSDYFEEALNLFEKAAKAGNNTAKFMLGYAYYKGFIVEQDFYQAVKLIRDASNAGFDEADYIFANIYANGNGIAKNYGNAIKHYRSAVSQGNVASMMELAQILAEGKMFPRNLIQAHILFNIASVYGAQNAAEYRDELEPALKMEELLEAQNAAESFKESPSELTQYIRQTFGPNIRLYIDRNLEKSTRKR
ncbi:MAG: sel1 repeat family protein [Alphaproteobacteria bacterium]|nr:sel1 repeat family protein [Alphaproteobacteria bacterium]